MLKRFLAATAALSLAASPAMVEAGQPSAQPAPTYEAVTGLQEFDSTTALIGLAWFALIVVAIAVAVTNHPDRPLSP